MPQAIFLCHSSARYVLLSFSLSGACELDVKISLFHSCTVSVGYVLTHLVLQLDVYDSVRALELFKGKYVVMFGDSTMEENMYDLIILLSGSSSDPEAMAHFLLSSLG